MLDLTKAFSLSFLIPENDVGISRLLRAHGEFAVVESELIADHLRAMGDGCYIDVGGNVGAIALPVAAARPDSRVVAIEGQRVLASLLAANAFNNALYNVDVIHAAAGAEPGLMPFPQVPLSAGPASLGQVSASQSPAVVAYNQRFRTETVRVCTLDEIAPDDTRFVKIDVEGFEPEVLKGAGRLLHQIRPAWLLEAAQGTEAANRASMRIMLEAGYRLFWFYAPFVTPNAKKLPRTPQNNAGDLNFLALPPGVPNLWALEEFDSADEPFPTRLSRFRYLERHGFKMQAPPIEGEPTVPA